jgi:hypothetical protein
MARKCVTEKSRCPPSPPRSDPKSHVVINLVDILKISGIPLRNWKLHLATGTATSPLEAYFNDEFKEWQEWQGKRNFQCEMVLSLIHLQSDQWLFGGVYKILGVRKASNHYQYRTELLPGQDDLIGRVIVRFKRDFRASYVRGERFWHRLEVSEIRQQRMTAEQFPGYDRMVINHDRLLNIVGQNDTSWKSALANIKGVYAIVDTNTGRLYIGSATGNEGIWQRWVNYAETGHGGNKELKALLSRKGMKYARNFQYTILEIADFHATDDDIKAREGHWKRALMSRDRGLNWN